MEIINYSMDRMSPISPCELIIFPVLNSPAAATSSTGTPVLSLMKPRMLKITNPAKILVPQLIKATSNASLKQT